MSNKEIFEAIEGLVKQFDGDTAGIIVIGAYDEEENDGEATGKCIKQGSAWRTGAAIVEDPRTLKSLAQAVGLYSILKHRATESDK